MKPLQHRRVKKAAGDKYFIKLDREYVSPTGIVDIFPTDLTGWKFRMYVHKHVEYCPQNEVFKTVGYVPNPESGIVFFLTCGCKVDIPPGMYWYSIEYETPNGKKHMTKSAKYEVVLSLNDYFSIYK